MLRRLSVILVAGLALAFGLATTASAAPVTNTHHEKGLVETFVDVIPDCEGGGPRYEITTTSNLVEHETIFADGRIHATFTQTGRFVAVPVRAGHPRYTGHFTTWGGFNQNGKTVNGTFTFNVHGKGSDGSTFKNHNVEHFNQRPDGSVNEFFRCH